MPTSSRLAIPTPTLGTTPVDIPADMLAIVTALETHGAGFAQGTFGARPAAGKTGYFYWDTTNSTLWYDNGSVWVSVGTPAASSITSAMIVDGTIVAADLANNAVAPGKALLTSLWDFSAGMLKLAGKRVLTHSDGTVDHHVESGQASLTVPAFGPAASDVTVTYAAAGATNSRAVATIFGQSAIDLYLVSESASGFTFNGYSNQGGGGVTVAVNWLADIW